MHDATDDPPRIVAPNADALLTRVGARIDDDMLREIAAADHGRDLDAHLAHLSALRDTGTIPVPLGFEPKEVLELVRWSEPYIPDWYPGGRGARGHWMRLFACAALLRTGQSAGNIGVLGGQNYTVVQLVESVSALNAGLEHDAASLIVWAMQQLQPQRAVHAEDLAFMGVGVLGLMMQAEPAAPDASLIALCEWVVRCEALARSQSIYPEAQGRWLLSVTSDTLCHEKWEQLGRSLLTSAQRQSSVEVRQWLDLIGGLLASA